MTIGIAASGPNAGLAVFQALAAVERVASGAIGGFAAFAALAGDGTLHRAETQRGGSRTLFTYGETTGVMPPPPVAAASMAAVMSSGPDRPAPLAQFVPAESGVGLVTGHRLPNAAGVSGQAVNLDVLQQLRGGASARVAVDTVLDANPQADAGLIAIDQEGRIHAGNSLRVARRPDLGHARRESARGGAVIEVLHNAIQPRHSLAALAAEIAMSIMAPPPPGAGNVVVRAGTQLAAGETHRIHVDSSGVVLRIETPDHRLLTGRHNCAAVYLGTAVVQEGRIIGYTLYEPNTVVDDGRLISLSGRTEQAIDYRAPEEAP